MNADAHLNLSALEQAELKRAMGCFATGVTVAATHHDGLDVGMTCNSFNTVSLDPALVLWSIRQQSTSRQAFTRGGGYTISVLGAGQRALAERFTKGAPHQRFDGVLANRQPSGRLTVADAVAWFDCELARVVPAGDHDILIGRVLSFAAEPAAPLLYLNGRFVED